MKRLLVWSCILFVGIYCYWSVNHLTRTVDDAERALTPPINIIVAQAEYFCDGVTYSLTLSDAWLQSRTRWATNAPQPSIRMKRVVDVALSSVRSEHPRRKWELRSISVRPLGADVWVLTVLFEDLESFKKTGVMNAAIAFVGLEGKLLKPRVEIVGRNQGPMGERHELDKSVCYRGKVSAEGLHYEGELLVLQKDVDGAPPWPLGNDPLPLSLNRAVDLARDALLLEIPQCGDGRACEGFDLFEIQLCRSEVATGWFYIITFMPVMPEYRSQFVSAVVLLNGKVIVPRRANSEAAQR